MVKIDWQNYFTRLDLAILFVATLAHDVNHPATNNAYQMRVNTKASQLYNGQSSLENYHVSILFQIFRSMPETNVFANVTPDQAKYC